MKPQRREDWLARVASPTKCLSPWRPGEVYTRPWCVPSSRDLIELLVAKTKTLADLVADGEATELEIVCRPRQNVSLDFLLLSFSLSPPPHLLFPPFSPVLPLTLSRCIPRWRRPGGDVPVAASLRQRWRRHPPTPSQSLTVLSYDLVANLFPSGAQATLMTQEV